MSMIQAIDMANATPWAPPGRDRRGSLVGERFPWQEESSSERLRGRATSLVAGLFLMLLVMVVNAAPIDALTARIAPPASAEQTVAPPIVVPPTPAPVGEAEPSAAASAGIHEGGARLQLGAYSTEEKARAAWTLFVGENRALQGRSPHLEQAMVRSKAVVRVQLAFASRTDAVAFRSTLDEVADSFVIG